MLITSNYFQIPYLQTLSSFLTLFLSRFPTDHAFFAKYLIKYISEIDLLILFL